jgi:hypothetical protein
MLKVLHSEFSFALPETHHTSFSLHHFWSNSLTCITQSKPIIFCAHKILQCQRWLHCKPLTMEFLKIFTSMDYEWENMLVVSENKPVSLSASQLSNQTCYSRVPVQWKRKSRICHENIWIACPPILSNYHFLCPYSTHRVWFLQLREWEKFKHFCS